MAALSGHQKPITVSRINPTLFKIPGQDLQTFSVIALASAESTITIWKPQLTKPLVIVMDLFKAGITDLSWGFNGNILLASSTDGEVAILHFQPGLLGTPCTEAEKRLIIQRKYGKSVLDDYVRNKKTQSA
jgi:WD40 repeat protein